MERIQRVWVVGPKGERQTFAFDMERFVSYNVDTKELFLDGACVIVHDDSEAKMILVYREWYNTKGAKSLNVKVRKLREDAVLPAKAHPTDAGFDLVATSKETDENEKVVYGTGLAFEIPEGHVGLLFPRSSISKKALFLTNSVGVIDSGYRGEVMFKFARTCPYEGYDYNVGDRIGQLIIMPYPDVVFEESDTLSDSERGTGGYGSSGK